MFTAQEKEIFATRGLIKRKAFIPTEKIEAAKQVILKQLQAQDIWADGGWQFQNYSAPISPDYGAKLIKPIKRQKDVVALADGEGPAAASALLNGQPVVPMSHPGLLFTLPNASEWSIPSKAWHLDMPRLPESGIPGVQMFVFINSVQPKGGGTLVVTGSHHLLNEGRRINSGQLRKLLKVESYFDELMSMKSNDRQHFLDEPVKVRGYEMQVVEMWGEAGDAYFMDLRLLHTIAPNANSTPRIMLTQRYLLESAKAAI